MVHGEEEFKIAEAASQILFNGTLADLAKLDEATFQDVFDGVPQYTLSKEELQKGVGVIDLLAEKTKIFPSKGEARKMIQGGGVSVNKEKVTAQEMIINASALIKDKYILIQKGRRNYYLCNVN
jgi:tyrosyl-tRNA synthetase